VRSARERFWDLFPTWEEAENSWDQQANLLKQKKPIQTRYSNDSSVYLDRTLKNRVLRIRSLLWVLTRDSKRELLKKILRYPVTFFFRYLKSLCRKHAYIQNEDCFFFGVKGLEDFCAHLDPKNRLLVVGFSYCQKPFECPSGRFSPDCLHESSSNICRQCLIGKAFHSLPTHKSTVFVIIPTINDIGRVILECLEKEKDRKVSFIITSCHMALVMFADLGAMVNVSGMGLRLQGRYCSTFEAFKLSEDGIKPGRTILSAESERILLEVLKLWREKVLSLGSS
jgi:hypothetical protein